MALVNNNLGGGHTHKHAHIQTSAPLNKKPGVCGWYMPGLKTCAIIIINQR